MGYEVELVEVDATPAAVVRGHVDLDRLGDFRGPAFGEVVAVADKQGRRISGAPFARYRESTDGQWDATSYTELFFPCYDRNER